jgi:hypothetical protein
MTVEPIPEQTSAEAKPDHIKRGLIVVGVGLAIVVGGVGIKMALQTPKQISADPSPKAEAPAPDPQNTFLQQFEQQRPKDTAPAPAAAAPSLAQGEIDAMQELRKSMSVKSAPAKQPTTVASAPPNQQRADDLDRQIQDLNRRIQQQGQQK